MNKLELWLLRRIFRKAVRQGWHRQKIVTVYRLLREAFEEEFTEDNRATQAAFLSECFEDGFQS